MFPQTSTICSNPPVPYVGRLPGGLTRGASIQIDGFLNHGAEPRLHVNIQDTLNSDNCIPLHLSFRTGEKCVVRNTRVKSKWGAEERQGGYPLRPGNQFRLTIAAQPTAFAISIDSAQFASFSYRMELEKAQFINIHGDVRIFNIVSINHNGIPPIAVCPPMHPNQPTYPVGPVHPNHPVHPAAPVHPNIGPIHPQPPTHPNQPPHGGCNKPKKDKKKDKKRDKKDKKRRGSCSSSSSSSSSD